jgi:sugar phosphate isomerase/epimerase
MKLGFLTAPLPDMPLMDVADWAAENGFEVLEIACWPRGGGATRRYAGTSHIDVVNLSPAQGREIAGEIADKGLSISGLGFYPNPLHPDKATARRSSATSSTSSPLLRRWTSRSSTPSWAATRPRPRTRTGRPP